MPLKNYSLLKGSLSDVTLDDDDSPHIELRIEANGTSYRIAINVRSKIAPHDLLYLRVNNYDNTVFTNAVRGIDSGIHDIPSIYPEIALDYVHGNLFRKDDFQIAPYAISGENNDLRDYIVPLVESAKNNDTVVVYALGEAWGPEAGKPDKYFGFTPGNGLHDIHMNQGSQGQFEGTNGPKQDGALLLHDTPTDTWTAIFLAFQSQSWNTDPDTGHVVGSPAPLPVQPSPLNPSLMIIAALVDAVGDEVGRESVTIINRADQDVDLAGWRIADHASRSIPLSGLLSAGMTMRVTLQGSADVPRLANKGGEIYLIAADGATAHSVAYAKADIGQEGWTVVFQ